MVWLSVVLGVGCGAVALLHGARAVRAPGRGVPAELSHLVMALGMAAMFATEFDPVPRAAWVVTFGAVAVWAFVAVVRGRDLGGEAGHHLVGGVAMLFMLLAGHHAAGWRAPVAIVLAGACAWHALRCVERLREGEQAPVGEPVRVGDAAGGGAAAGGGVRRGAERGSGASGAAAGGGAERGGAERCGETGGGAVADRRVGVQARTARAAAFGHVVVAVAMAVMLLGAL